MGARRKFPKFTLRASNGESSKVDAKLGRFGPVFEPIGMRFSKRGTTHPHNRKRPMMGGLGQEFFCKPLFRKVLHLICRIVPLPSTIGLTHRELPAERPHHVGEPNFMFFV